jgi:ribonuclease J
MKESEELIEEAKNVIRNTLKNHEGRTHEMHYMRRTIEDSLKKFFFKKTKRNPLVIAVILEV